MIGQRETPYYYYLAAFSLARMGMAVPSLPMKNREPIDGADLAGYSLGTADGKGENAPRPARDILHLVQMLLNDKP